MELQEPLLRQRQELAQPMVLQVLQVLAQLLVVLVVLVT
jgi:hypothetical protein